jgi:hypothetical protein
MKLASLNPYWVYIKVGAALLVCGLMFGWGYHTANLAGRLALESERRQIAEDARLQIEAAQKQAYDADERYRKAQQAAPKAAPKIREVTRANPSGCNVPKPVGDGLRGAIRSGNKSISG